MKLRRLLCAALFLIVGNVTFAGSFINTNGSKDGVAISGYDPVAFFTQKKATLGNPQHTFEWMGAKWYFASEEHLKLFKSSPEKYAPQYGGHCSLGLSEGYISAKPANGYFEIVRGKLYLFPDGGRTKDGAHSWWWASGGGPHRRIPDGDAQWPKLKAKLEAQ